MTIRVNCLDCLDRTNAVQTKFAFLNYLQVLENFETLNLYDLNNFRRDPLSLLDKSHQRELTDFRILWANNGDAISMVYAGTGATTSSVTRRGDKSSLTSALDHGLKTIKRFYINNFEDDYRQEIIDCLLANVKIRFTFIM